MEASQLDGDVCRRWTNLGLRVLLWAWMGEGYREGGAEWSHSTFPINGFQELRKMVAPTFGGAGHPSRG